MQLLRTDPEALAHVRSFFGALPATLGIEAATQSNDEALVQVGIAETEAIVPVAG